MRRKRGLSFIKERKKIEMSLLKEIFVWILGIAISIFLSWFIVFSIGIQTTIIGTSMQPQLLNGQPILIDTVIYNFRKPKREDVIVFLPNGNENSHYYVKRIVGEPGESILIDNGYLYIDGIVYDNINDEIADAGIAKLEIIIGDNEYFVIGDNINNSEDSRSGNIGLVSKDMMLGKAWLKLKYKNDDMNFIK